MSRYAPRTGLFFRKSNPRCVRIFLYLYWFRSGRKRKLPIKLAEASENKKVSVENEESSPTADISSEDVSRSASSASTTSVVSI